MSRWAGEPRPTVPLPSPVVSDHPEPSPPRPPRPPVQVGARYGSHTITVAMPFSTVRTDERLTDSVAELARLVARLADTLERPGPKGERERQLRDLRDAADALAAALEAR